LLDDDRPATERARLNVPMGLAIQTVLMQALGDYYW